MKCFKQIVPGMMIASIALADNRYNKIDQAIVRNLVTSINNGNGKVNRNLRRMIADEEPAIAENQDQADIAAHVEEIVQVQAESDADIPAQVDEPSIAIEEADQAIVDANAIQEDAELQQVSSDPVSSDSVSSESSSYSYSDSVSSEETGSAKNPLLQALKDKVIKVYDEVFDQGIAELRAAYDSTFDAALDKVLTEENLEEYFIGKLEQEALPTETVNDEEPAIAENEEQADIAADTAETVQVQAELDANIPAQVDEPSIAIEKADQAIADAEIDDDITNAIKEAIAEAAQSITGATEEALDSVNEVVESTNANEEDDQE